MFLASVKIVSPTFAAVGDAKFVSMNFDSVHQPLLHVGNFALPRSV